MSHLGISFPAIYPSLARELLLPLITNFFTLYFQVNISMENLETVVRERNKAYHLLETGIDGERKGYRKENQLGIVHYYKETEHLIPSEYNRKWQQKFNQKPRGHAVNKFLLNYRERLWNEKRKKLNRDRNEVIHILRRFPNVDRKKLGDRYPSVNIDKLNKQDKFRGHYVPN